MTKTLEEIMERLMRLDRIGVCIHMRDSFPPGPHRWYIEAGRVSVSSLTSGGYCFSWGEGATPEEAAQNIWMNIISRPPDSIFIRYNCESNVLIPGKEPQVWVRWNDAIDDWEDVVPTGSALAKHGITRDRIRTYQQQKSIDC